MICTHSEAHDADGGFVVHRNTTPQTSSNLFGWVEIHCQRFSFWCCDKCMTLGMRVTPTNAEPGERRQVSNISDAISVARAGWPHPKHLLGHTAEAHRQFRLPLGQGRVAEWRVRHLTRKDQCLWFSALRLRSTALPYATVVAAYSMAGRGLFRNARRRTTWVATQIVCSLVEPYSQEPCSVESALFTVLSFSGSTSGST